MTTDLAASPQSQIATSESFTSAFSSERSFEAAQRMAKALVSSSLVPTTYQGQQNIGSAIIALEIAQRLQCSPLMVMQNLHVIHGRPSWSSQFIIASLNSCKRFSPLRFDMDGEGDHRQCIAWATDKANGERLDGPPISIEIAKKEGWYQKNGSKWQTMPELMLRYRAASFFGKLYAPDVLMGMQTEEEVIDIVATEVPEPKRPIFAKQEALPEKTAEATEILTPEPSAELPIEERPEAPWETQDHIATGEPPSLNFTPDTPQKEILARLHKEGRSEPEFFAALKALDQKTTARTVNGLSDVFSKGVINDWELLIEQLNKA